MVTWPLLKAIAGVVWERYRRLQEEADRLLKEKRPLTEFQLPADPPIPDGLPVTFREDYCELSDTRGLYSPEERRELASAPDRWRYLGWSASEGEIQPFPLWLMLSAEVEDRTITFFFTTTSAWDNWYREDGSLEARQAQRRELHRLKKVIRAGVREATAGRSLEGKNREEWERAVEKYRRLAPRWDLDALRRSPRLKQELFWAWQAWDREALGRLYWPRAKAEKRAELVKSLEPILRLNPPQLGPIVLSRATNPEEISLKMALLSARRGLLNSSDLQPVIPALQRYLGTTPGLADEVFSAVVMTNRGMGYVGDLSHLSFRIYLRKVARSLKRPNGLVRLREDWAADEAELASGEIERPKGHPRPRRAVRIPEDGGEPHPWAVGKPTLLARLAVEFQVPPHVARTWVREGKLKASDCPPRQEVTLLGDRSRGRIEVPASERKVWDDLCVRYHDMQERKRGTESITASEKKRRYRTAAKPGGSRDTATRMVVGMAVRAGIARAG